MDIEQYLKTRAPIKDESWIASLDNRKKEEASFHDFVRSEESEALEMDCHSNLKLALA